MTEAISLKDVYNELRRIEKNMVTKTEVESLIDTIGILGNPETMKQIADSIQDIEKGKVKEINSVHDLLSEI